MIPGLSPSAADYSLFALRRKDLLQAIKQEHLAVNNGLVVLCAGFEQERYAFRQESSFYYFTGLQEPGLVLTIDMNGKTTLYVPQSKTDRSAWMHAPIKLVQENAKTIQCDTITAAGVPTVGYHVNLFSDVQSYSNVLEVIKKVMAEQGSVFTLAPTDASSYLEQRVLLQRFATVVPNLPSGLIDISPLIARMRRHKDMHEIEKLYKAVEITILAQEAAARSVTDGITECEVQASLEYMFTGSCARPAFPSIVATGKNGTILHYSRNADTLHNGQLAVVDIGAEYGYYCADLTRTYPVSGKFSKRQRELYEIVLATQEYVASRAKPGMWLSNKEKPEQSLHHIAYKFLEQKGYAKYFIHGIGHFLGMDVHDVGNGAEPLQEGDVFTIEPGIYIPAESIGIRIEDNYWMVKDGVVCLSEALPKKPDDIEGLMQESLIDNDDELEEEYEEESAQDLDFAQS